jgi:hypothetical protein
MGQRYNDAVSKENRLESGTRPVAFTAKLAGGREKDGDASNHDDEEDETKEKSSSKKKRKKPSKKEKSTEPPTSFRAQQDPSALEQADEVAEGIDWSDED